MATLPFPSENANPLAAVWADHDCFGCGERNPIGLKLRFRPTGEGVAATFVPAAPHQGYERVVHGGIISTVLDEAMAWAVANEGIWAVTGEMRVRFRRPLHVGQPTTATAKVTERRGRVITVASTLTLDEEGAVVATATATFVRVDEETEAAWRARYLQEPPSNQPVLD